MILRIFSVVSYRALGGIKVIVDTFVSYLLLLSRSLYFQLSPTKQEITALRYNIADDWPEGKRRTEGPKTTWRPMIEYNINDEELSGRHG